MSFEGLGPEYCFDILFALTINPDDYTMELW